MIPLTPDALDAAAAHVAAFCRAHGFVPTSVHLAFDSIRVHVPWDAFATAYAGHSSTAHMLEGGGHHHEIEDDGLRVVAIDPAASREIVDGRVTL